MQTVQQQNNHKLAKAVTVLTVVFFAFSIFNIWETHKYRRMEYDLKKSGCCNCGK